MSKLNRPKLIQYLLQKSKHSMHADVLKIGTLQSHSVESVKL